MKKSSRTAVAKKAAALGVTIESAESNGSLFDIVLDAGERVFAASGTHSVVAQGAYAAEAWGLVMEDLNAGVVDGPCEDGYDACQNPGCKPQEKETTVSKKYMTNPKAKFEIKEIAPMSTLTVRSVGTKTCPFCRNTARQSNGQCECRNVLYRAVRGKGFTADDIAEATKVYDEEIQGGSTPADARETMRVCVPAVAPVGRVKTPKHAAIEKPDQTWACQCGFVGKGSQPSVKSHVARALKEEA